MRVQVGIEHQRKDVKQRDRQSADERSASQPLQLLPENTGRGFTVAPIENKPGNQETGSKITEFDLFKNHVGTEPGHKTEGIQGRADMDQNQSERQEVHSHEFRRRANGCFSSPRKNQGEVKK